MSESTYVLDLQSIRCNSKTDGEWGKDELLVQVLLDGIKIALPERELGEGEEWHVKREYTFKEKAKVRLNEDDQFDDDHIGSFWAKKSSGSYSKEVEGSGASYTVEYSIRKFVANKLRGFQAFNPNAGNHSRINSNVLAHVSAMMYAEYHDKNPEDWNGFKSSATAKLREYMRLEKYDEEVGVTVSRKKVSIAAPSWNHTEYAVASNRSFTVVGFRGTDGLLALDEVSEGIDLAPMTVPWVSHEWYELPPSAHGAFLAVADKVYDNVRDLIVQQRSNTAQPVWVTGHSRGGAIAYLVAMRLSLSGINVRGVCTFGAPRCVDLVMKAKLEEELGNKRIWRWVNAADFVPGIIPPGVYWHAGKLNHIQEDGTVKYDAAPFYLTLPNFDDHDMARYLGVTYEELSNEQRKTVPLPVHW